ncbi:MAG TPA: tetratricopeptide repeat protein [Rhizomicrobium sp.]
MSDIFREVEEEVRKERLDQLWKQYGDYVVAGACFLIIGAAGFQIWKTYDQKQHMKASDQYTVAQSMMDAGQATQAADAFGRLADTAPSGYKELARLQHADAAMASGERGDALALYKQIAAGDDPVLAAVAKLHAAWGIADSQPRADVVATLGALDDETSPWRPLAQEIIAYSDYRAGNTKAALAEYTALGASPKSAGNLRLRAKYMADFLKAGGDANYGAVPEPPKTPADQQQQPIDPRTGMPVDPNAAQGAAPQGAAPGGPQAPNPNVAPNPNAPGHP